VGRTRTRPGHRVVNNRALYRSTHPGTALATIMSATSQPASEGWVDVAVAAAVAARNKKNMIRLYKTSLMALA